MFCWSEFGIQWNLTYQDPTYPDYSHIRTPLWEPIMIINIYLDCASIIRIFSYADSQHWNCPDKWGSTVFSMPNLDQQNTKCHWFSIYSINFNTNKQTWWQGMGKLDLELTGTALHVTSGQNDQHSLTSTISGIKNTQIYGFKVIRVISLFLIHLWFEIRNFGRKNGKYCYKSWLALLFCLNFKYFNCKIRKNWYKTWHTWTRWVWHPSHI